MTEPVPLEELCAAAGIRLRRSSNDPTFDALLPIIRGLLAMRKAGWLESVTVNDSRLSIQFPRERRSQKITWHQAEYLVSRFNGGAQ